MQINCPSCKRQLRVPDTAAGKKVKCPACSTSFTALDQVEEMVEPGPPPPKPKPKVDVVDVVDEAPPPPRPRRVRDEDDDDRPRRSRDRDEEDDDRPRRSRDRDDDDDDHGRRSRDLDDDDDRRSRRRDQDDDYDRPRRRRRGSGAGSVTGNGVITIIIGSLSLLCGICLMIGAIAGAGAAGGQFGGNVLPQWIAGMLIVIALLVLIFGVLYLVGGIGVLQRRNWGRIITLVCAGFSGIFGVFLVLSFIGNLISPVPMEMKIMPVLVALLGAIVYFAHCVMSFIVLLSGDNARDFR